MELKLTLQRTERRSGNALYNAEDKENSTAVAGGKKKGTASGVRAAVAVR